MHTMVSDYKDKHSFEARQGLIPKALHSWELKNGMDPPPQMLKKNRPLRIDRC